MAGCHWQVVAGHRWPLVAVDSHWGWPVADAGQCSRPACDYQIKKCLQICSGQFPPKISLGGIPDSCNVLFLQIFLKRAAQPSARNTSAGFP